MAIAHLSYVICDVCGMPASQPVDDAKAARERVPADWTRVIDPQTRWGRDLCPVDGAQENRRDDR